MIYSDIESLRGILADFWQRGEKTEPPKWLTIVGLVSLILFASTQLAFGDIGKYAGKGVVLIGFYLWLVYGGRLRHPALLFLLAAVVILPILSWSGALLTHPEWAESSPKIHRMTGWLMFTPVAALLHHGKKTALFIWCLALIGLLSVPFVNGFSLHGMFADFTAGRRADMGFQNAQHAGLVYATLLIGMLVFTKRMNLFSKGWWYKLPSYFSILSFLSFMVVLSQTRGVWLGLLCALIASVFIALYTFKRCVKTGSGIVVILSLFCFLLFMSFKFATPVINVIDKRVFSEKQSIDKIASGDFSEIENRSLYIRVNSWVEAVDWINKKPLLGWGGNGRRLVMEHSSRLPAEIRNGIKHLHNSYLEILVNFGLFGLGVYFSIISWLLWVGRRAWKNGLMSGDVFSFFVLFQVFWFVSNMFESYLSYTSGSYLFALICGGTLSLAWNASVEYEQRYFVKVGSF